MRIVPIRVSHWHTPFFLDPCLEMADVAFALARHCDMAELARFPIDSRLSPLPAQ